MECNPKKYAGKVYVPTLFANSDLRSWTSSMTASWNPGPEAISTILACRKPLCASQWSPSVVETPLLPFWKKVPEYIPGRPENSLREKAS